MRTERDNEMQAIQGISRIVGRSEDHLDQLCEELRERMNEADARKGIKPNKNKLVRKRNAGQALEENLLYTYG